MERPEANSKLLSTITLAFKNVTYEFILSEDKGYYSLKLGKDQKASVVKANLKNYIASLSYKLESIANEGQDIGERVLGYYAKEGSITLTPALTLQNIYEDKQSQKKQPSLIGREAIVNKNWKKLNDVQNKLERLFRDLKAPNSRLSLRILKDKEKAFSGSNDPNILEIKIIPHAENSKLVSQIIISNPVALLNAYSVAHDTVFEGLKNKLLILIPSLQEELKKIPWKGSSRDSKKKAALERKEAKSPKNLNDLLQKAINTQENQECYYCLHKNIEQIKALIKEFSAQTSYNLECRETTSSDDNQSSSNSICYYQGMYGNDKIPVYYFTPNQKLKDFISYHKNPPIEAAIVKKEDTSGRKRQLAQRLQDSPAKKARNQWTFVQTPQEKRSANENPKKGGTLPSFQEVVKNTTLPEKLTVFRTDGKSFDLKLNHGTEQYIWENEPQTAKKNSAAVANFLQKQAGYFLMKVMNVVNKPSILQSSVITWGYIENNVYFKPATLVAKLVSQSNERLGHKSKTGMQL